MVESKVGEFRSGPAQVLVDLGLYAQFPTLSSGPGVALTLLSQMPLAGPAVDAGATVWLASTESGLWADAFLGDFDAGMFDRLCYWYDLSLDGPSARLQQWTIEPATEGPITFGGQVSLRGVGSGNYLTRSGLTTEHGYLATGRGRDTWTIVPISTDP